ncbi:hypothetical protein [Paenibacillus sp. UNC499MF]|uniref:hypothetical protein n=1 Tax=Paenibacillus sp. UNC499MF TaxID=1502751 RepID=UPI0008A01D64|nr:hypothetical protein [Paenibacillus sp. UNC499MF]SEG70041.1 hypothetical protein SAMN02799616_04364 [Paenibacillus sp. UNC499MF]
MRPIRILFRRDFIHGFQLNFMKWILAGVVLVLIVLWAIWNRVDGENRGILILVNILEGYAPGEGENLKLPSDWLAIHIVFLYVIGQYTSEDFRVNGTYIFPRVRNPWRWWMSKILWTVLSVVLYYGLLLAVGFVLSLLLLPAILPVKGLEDFELLMVAVLLSSALTLLMGLLQTVLSLWFSTIMSFFVTLAVLLICCYVQSIWLPGDYGMLIRSPYLETRNLWDLTAAFLYFSVSCTGLAFAGHYVIRGKDVLPKSE